MRQSRRTTMIALTAALGLGAVGVPAAAQDPVNYILATATTGGTYYPVGVAIATLTKVKLEPKQKIGMSAISSAGSGENVRLLREGEAQFAILQGLFGQYAWNGTGPVTESGKQEKLRSVSMLWQNVEHFVVAAKDAKTGTIDDFLAIKGTKVGMGAQSSGTIGSNRAILANLGVDMDKEYELFYAGYGPTVEAMQNGQLEGLSAPGGVPVGAITQLFASAGDGVKLLSFTDEQIAKAGGDLWTAYLIPAETYPGQAADLTTIAQPNLLVTTIDVPEEHVYQITKTMFENLPFLNAIHPATKAMAIDKALAGLPIPLHPGAARYFEEVGVDIPARLLID